MGDFAILVVIFLAIALLAFAIVLAWDRTARKAAPQIQPWQVEVHTIDGTYVAVYVTHPGSRDSAMKVGEPIHCGALDFDEQLAERNLDAAMRADALNRRLPA